MNVQLINLYLPEFRPKREVITALNSGIAVLLFIFMLGFIHMSKTKELKLLELRVGNLNQESTSLQESVAILKNTPIGGDRKRLERKIERVRAAIENRNQIKKIMSGQSLGNEFGFSRYLDALSSFADKGLYLDEFNLRQGGRFAQISGVSKKSESVPLYISRLQGGSIFADTKFGLLNIEKQGSHVRFWSEGEHGSLSEGKRSNKGKH